MTYCPECGSEVAPENTFCSYCGIALTPVVSQPEIQAPQPENHPASEKSREPEFFALVPPAEPVKSTVETPVFEQPESLPPTPAILENAANDASSFHEIKEPQKDHQSTAENWSPKTDLIDFPLTDANASSKEDPWDFSELERSPAFSDVSSVKSDDPFQSFPDKKIEDKSLPAEQSDYDKKAFTDNESATLEEFSGNPGSYGYQKPEIEKVPLAEPDFQSTIPYTPQDYISQELTPAPGLKESQKAQNQAERPLSSPLPPPAPLSQSNEIPVPSSQEGIAKPETPVGSSSYDSLAPTLISVQIYNPNERPEEQGKGDIPNKSIAANPVVEVRDQEKSQPIVRHTEVRESRSATSPNMGGSDTDGKSKTKLKPLDEGTVLNGRYEIIRKIGGGGMGAVYLASDRNLGGILRAVKEMVQSYIEDAQQDKAINDFKRESLLLTSLEHPTIPTIFDYFYDEQENRFYLVMKYISGGDLAARLRSAPEGKIDEANVTEWSIQVADVLDYLHNRQPPIVYRDLKPSNIMIDGNSGRIMLIDFGIARWVNKEEKGVTAVGTMGYAPPELFSGNVEPRSDIYSLGSTMFHLLTGADPQSNPLLIFDFQKHPRPRQINSLLSDQIEKILMRAVEYNADRRFANAAELRDALTQHLENLKKGNVTFGAGDAATAPKPNVNELVFCGFCGQKIVATDVFCPFCGAQQPLAAAAAGLGASVPNFVAPKLAKIMIVSTNDLDSPVFSLDKETNLVGRRDPMSNIFPEVDLSKFDPQTKISRRHARIWRENDKFMVEDLGSSNGTLLIKGSNEPERLMKNQPHMLMSGDKLRVGDTTLHFVIS